MSGDIDTISHKIGRMESHLETLAQTLIVMNSDFKSVNDKLTVMNGSIAKAHDRISDEKEKIDEAHTHALNWRDTRTKIKWAATGVTFAGFLSSFALGRSVLAFFNGGP